MAEPGPKWTVFLSKVGADSGRRKWAALEAKSNFFVRKSPANPKKNGCFESGQFSFKSAHAVLTKKGDSSKREILLIFIKNNDTAGQLPSWRSWLARQSHNLKVVSSSLTEGILFFFSLQDLFKITQICM